MILSYTERARAEFFSTYTWYEEQQSGLGRRFLRVFRRLIDNIFRHPEMYPQHRDNIRCAFMGQFPYSIFYSVESEVILIVSVFKASRNPELKP